MFHKNGVFWAVQYMQVLVLFFLRIMVTIWLTARPGLSFVISNRHFFQPLLTKSYVTPYHDVMFVQWLLTVDFLMLTDNFTAYLRGIICFVIFKTGNKTPTWYWWLEVTQLYFSKKSLNLVISYFDTQRILIKIKFSNNWTHSKIINWPL